MKVGLPKHIAEEMIAHAQEEAPIEACGILAAKDGRVARLYRTRNADQSPVTYRIDPQEQRRVFGDIEAHGWEVWGIYHSHPNGRGLPSLTDVRRATLPQVYYLIVSLQRPEKPLIRAFRVLGGHILEEKVVVE
ncbi:MAG: M67 family metallopeptidase [Chloroflexi bacterium]|nr:M67 family metallopeptidase [Chloroflexota bacterium]